MKSKKIAYLLWLVSIFGCLGLHRFYLQKMKTGLIWLCTGGLVGIGSLIDLFTLGEQVRQINRLLILEKLANGEEIANLEHLLAKNNLHTDIYCPYCMGKLAHKPKRNLKCPFCRNEIYIRANQGVFENVLLTRENAIFIDHLKALVRFGIGEDDFIQKRAELVQMFGDEIAPVDVIWSLIRQTTLNIKNPDLLRGLHRRTSLLLKDLNRSFYYVLQRSAKMQLLDYRRDGYTKLVRVVSSGSDSCPVCRQLEGKIYTIDDALRLMPVPCKECTHLLTKEVSGFCRCIYQAEDY